MFTSWECSNILIYLLFFLVLLENLRLTKRYFQLQTSCRIHWCALNCLITVTRYSKYCIYNWKICLWIKYDGFTDWLKHWKNKFCQCWFVDCCWWLKEVSRRWLYLTLPTLNQPTFIYSKYNSSPIFWLNKHKRLDWHSARVLLQYQLLVQVH